MSTNFSIGLLITIYAVIILGGLGSIAGVVVGAIIINCVFVFLEPQTDDPGFKRWLFYGAIILLIALLKPWYKAVVLFVGTIASGFIVHAVVGAWGKTPYNFGPKGDAIRAVRAARARACLRIRSRARRRRHASSFRAGRIACLPSTEFDPDGKIQ